MKKRLVPALLGLIALLALIATWGCAAARVYPVKGPLSLQTPPPIYSAKMSGVFYSGTFSTALDGEKFTGHWERVPRDNAPSSKIPTPQDLSSEWDSVYGVGFYRFKVREADFYLRTLATGNRGTILYVEMYRTEQRPVIGTNGNEIPIIDMRGVARDNKGNVYKLIFRT
jgi:hypothetical protein